MSLEEWRERFERAVEAHKTRKPFATPDVIYCHPDDYDGIVRWLDGDGDTDAQ